MCNFSAHVKTFFKHFFTLSGFKIFADYDHFTRRHDGVMLQLSIMEIDESSNCFNEIPLQEHKVSYQYKLDLLA